MEELGRKVVRVADTTVDHVLVGLLALLFVLGCYSLWDSQQVYSRANATQWQPYKPVEPEPLSFWELQRMNPDVRAWLSVYGTNIDYPVCQNEDMNKYLETNAKGEYSLSGSLFMDSHSAADFSDFSTIVYGHHMDKDVMFGQITDFLDRGFFDIHQYGNLFVDDIDYGLEFFCYLKADAYDRDVYRHGIEGAQERGAYLGLLQERATRWRNGVSVGPEDRILLLSTCASGATNERAILVGKICGETFENPFVTIPNYGTGVDSNWGWLGIPWWCWIVLAVFLLLLAALLLAQRKRRSHA